MAKNTTKQVFQPTFILNAHLALFLYISTINTAQLGQNSIFMLNVRSKNANFLKKLFSQFVK